MTLESVLIKLSYGDRSSMNFVKKTSLLSFSWGKSFAIPYLKAY
jgi:hypothetical protein